jgi:cobalt-zinc-cadmium efflux system membrane fusion protein
MKETIRSDRQERETMPADPPKDQGSLMPARETDKPVATMAPRRGLVGILLVVAAVVAIGGYRLLVSGGPAPGTSPATESAPHAVREGERVTVPEGSPLRNKLEIATVAAQEVERTLVLPGVVESDPARLAKVAPPLAGRVMTLNVQLGQRVEAGQALAVLDSPDLAAAYADYDRAKVQLDFATKNRDRARDLQKIGGAALKDLQQAETDYVSAVVERDRAEARLHQINVDPETKNKTRMVTIVAPMAGSVTDLGVAPGAYWNDPTAPLMTVADLHTVWVTANVPEKDTASISKGQSVEVRFPAFPDEIWKGEVLFVSDVLDPDTRRTKVRILFDNPEIRLKPNMFADVSFFTPRQTVPVVPTAAIILKNDTDRVFVEVAPWTFEPRRVEVGFQQNNQAVVKSGVKAGDRIVVKGGVLLND